MSFRDAIILVACLVSVSLGLALKYERRAELREARQQERAERRAMAESLHASKGKAERHLDAFLDVEKLVSGPDATVKIRIKTESGSEHIWVSDLSPTKFIGRKPIEFTGLLSNKPEDIAGMELGDQIAFSRFVIEDWGLVVEGRGYGFYSVRALLPYLPEEEAVPLNAFLMPSALPDDWAALAASFAPAEPRIDPRERFMSHLNDPPATWDGAMVLVSWMKVETKSDGKSVGYAQNTWVEHVERREDGMLTGTPVIDELFGQAHADAEPIVFAETKIIDWGFVEDGLGYGFAFLREGKLSQTPRQSQKLAAFFAPDMLPEGW